jgi:hypothetical protein
LALLDKFAKGRLVAGPDVSHECRVAGLANTGRRPAGLKRTTQEVFGLEY